MVRYQVYVNGNALPDTITIPNLRRMYDVAVVQMDKAQSKDDNSIRLSRRRSLRPLDLQFMLPLGANSVFDGIEAKAGGFSVRIVIVEEIDINGDGQADQLRELFELTLENVVVVDRDFNLATGQDVLYLQSASPLRKRLLPVPA